MHKEGAKRPTTDVIEICYHPLKDKICQNSVLISPKSLEKKSKKVISELLINTYNDLKKSKKQIKNNSGFIIGTPKKISKKHSEILNKLKKYIYDDFEQVV